MAWGGGVLVAAKGEGKEKEARVRVFTLIEEIF